MPTPGDIPCPWGPDWAELYATGRRYVTAETPAGPITLVLRRNHGPLPPGRVVYWPPEVDMLAGLPLATRLAVHRLKAAFGGWVRRIDPPEPPEPDVRPRAAGWLHVRRSILRPTREAKPVDRPSDGLLFDPEPVDD